MEVFSELNQEDTDLFKAKVGLDEADYEDKNIQELLEVFDEVKYGLEGPEEEGEEEMEDDDEEQGEDALEDEDQQ